jgi:hypothetical protein
MGRRKMTSHGSLPALQPVSPNRLRRPQTRGSTAVMPSTSKPKASNRRVSVLPGEAAWKREMERD